MIRNTVLTRIILSVVLAVAGNGIIACDTHDNIDEEANEKSLVCDEFEISDQDFPCLTNLPLEALSQAEINGLLYMREEEKLARDVYIFMYTLYPQPIFNNISKSEQRHTDAIKTLLERYELNDPVAEDIKGSFKNQTLQNLYDNLIEKGKVDRIEALKVGALIEETDIQDIENELEKNVDNQDISTVYGNLLRGSKNHLKAFVNVLKASGVEYEPVLLDLEIFNEIVE